jgi:Kef-type K+ transport system membrane component KefB
MTFLPDWPNAADPLLLFSILLLAGLAAGELVQRALRLPRITGYVLVGALVGLFSQRVFGRPLMEDARLFADIALGLVLFELGRRFDFAWLKRDRWLMATGLTESAATFAAVYGVLHLLDFHAAWAAVAAAIAMATSPAVVMLVVRDTRSEGQVTERALCFTALNCIAAGITTTMLLSWLHLEYKSGWMSVVLHPLYLLVGAGVAAWVLARLLILAGRWCGKRETAQFVLLVGTVILAVGVAEMLKLSVLLTLLLLGMLSRNLDRHHALLNIEFGYAAQPFFVILFVVTVGAADVDVLAEHRELLGEIAVQFGHVAEARRVVDAPLAPLLEGVGAAAAQRQVQAVAVVHQHVADGAQFGEQRVVAGVYHRRDLDHALRDLRLDVARMLLLLDAREQVGGAAHEIVVAVVEDLQFQFHPHGEGFGPGEFDDVVSHDGVPPDGILQRA